MTPTGEDLRWTVYRQVAAVRHGPPALWRTSVPATFRRVRELQTHAEPEQLPRWRHIEAWTVAAHSPEMAAAGGFRLAFWNEDRHGPRLQRALDRYRRHVDVRPSDFPAGADAALAHFFAHQTARQSGPTHGMAYDTARFDRFTKDMAAYHHVTRADYLYHATSRARRRAQRLAEQVNSQLKLAFRINDGSAARLRTARELLDSPHLAHQAAGRRLHGAQVRQQRLDRREHALLDDRSLGLDDERANRACRYAHRWGLPGPAA